MLNLNQLITDNNPRLKSEISQYLAAKGTTNFSPSITQDNCSMSILILKEESNTVSIIFQIEIRETTNAYVDHLSIDINNDFISALNLDDINNFSLVLTSIGNRKPMNRITLNGDVRLQKVIVKNLLVNHTNIDLTTAELQLSNINGRTLKVLGNHTSLKSTNCRLTTESSLFHLAGVKTENIHFEKCKSDKLFLDMCTADYIELASSPFPELYSYISTIEYLHIIGSSIDKFSIEQTGPKGQRESIISLFDTSIDHLLLDNLEIGKATKFDKVWKSLTNSQNNKLRLDLSNCTLRKCEARIIKWNYNGISTPRYCPDDKSFLLNSLKNYYASKQDIPNTAQLESFEKIWYWEQNKWNIPLSLSMASNRFGLSITRPIIWILTVVILEILFIISYPGECQQVYLDNWGIYFHLLNPTHRTETFFHLTQDKCHLDQNFKNLFYAIDNIFRIIIGYLLFQFVNAFRHKYKLK